MTDSMTSKEESAVLTFLASFCHRDKLRVISNAHVDTTGKVLMATDGISLCVVTLAVPLTLEGMGDSLDCARGLKRMKAGLKAERFVQGTFPHYLHAIPPQREPGNGADFSHFDAVLLGRMSAAIGKLSAAFGNKQAVTRVEGNGSLAPIRFDADVGTIKVIAVLMPCHAKSEEET